MAKLIDTSYEASPVKASPAKAKPVKVKPVKVKPAKQEPTTNSRSTNSRGANSRSIDPLRQDSEWAQSWAKETRDKAQHTEAKAETEVKPTSTGASGKTFTMPFTPKIVTTNNSRNIDPMKQNAEWARSWAKGVLDGAASAKAEAAAKEKRAELLSVYGDTSKQSATDIFKTTEGGTGGNYGSQHTEELREQLNRFHDKELMPSYSNYQQILKDYNAGKATAAQLEEARLDYASKYYQYAPLYGAYETLRHGNIAVSGDSTTLRDSFDRWGAASTAAENAVTASGERLAQLRADYEKELAAYQADPSSGRDKLTKAGLKYEEAAGKYNADLFVLQEIVELTGLLGRQSNRAAEREQQEYYDAHPYALRADDTAESIAERTAALKADYEAAQSAMQAAGKKYTADYDVEAFGVGAGYSDAAKAAYDSAREAYDAARLNYEHMQALNDWASDPAHLESRSEWESNGWTWDDRFFEYQQTGDKSVLDDLVYGYGNFVATPWQRQQLTAVLEQEFKDAKADRYVELPEFQSVRTADPEIEKVYREAQARLHQMGQKATDVNDITEAIGLTVASDFASLGALVFDAVSAGTRLIGGKTEFLDYVSGNIKAERAMVQEAMARETTGMSYAESMAIQLAPSIVECLFSMIGAETLLVGSAPAGATTTGLTQAARMSQSMTKTEEFLRIGSMTMQDMARNPQYWTSFARVAGTDYVDSLNEGASQSQAMMYALVDGSLNALIEIGGGGIQSLPRTVETLENPTFRRALREALLKSTYEEGMEEVYQGIVERSLSAVILNQNRQIGSVEDKEAIFSLSAALEEFIGGATVSLLVGMPRSVEAMKDGAKRDQTIRTYNQLNQMLPEDLRLSPLDAETATNDDIQDFENALRLRTLVTGVADAAVASRRSAEAGLSEAEVLQLRIEAANPDKAVLDTMASTIQDKGYGDAVKAQEQSDLIRKVLGGEKLTSGEVRQLDLNNPAVREVFVERTGLKGMPTNTELTGEGVRAYADAAARVAREAQASLKEMQKTIAERNAETAKATPTTTNDVAADTTAQTDADEGAKGNDSKGLDLLKRKLNKEIRRARGKKAQEAAIAENRRHREIATGNRTVEDVIAGVSEQSGVSSILTFEEFRKSDMARSANLGPDESGKALSSLDLRGQYYRYLTGIGLTRAEADAIMRVQPLTKAKASAYTEEKTVKEDVKDGRAETADDGGDTGRAGSGGGLVLAERDGQRGKENDERGGESADSGLGQPGGGSVVPSDSDAAGPDVSEKSPGGAEPERLTDEIRKALGEKYKEAKIKDWSDAPVSQLSETEASSFTQLTDLVRRATGSDVYLLNTQGLGVALEPEEGARAAGEFVTINGHQIILVAADLAVADEYSPTRTLAHECVHALFKKNGRGATRGKLRMKIMTDMTLLKAYNAFKASPMGKAYVKAAKGDEYIICEEYAAKVLAHQYGTEAEQKAIEKFVEDNAPDFPVAEYIRKVRTLDELYGAPKTVDQFIEKKPGAPDGELPPPQDSKRPPAPKKVSPQARKLAADNGIDLSEITGSGKQGMVRVADVMAVIEKQAEIEAAKAETPKTEAPKTEAPKAETPKAEKPIRIRPAKTEAPKTEAPKTEKPITVRPVKTEAPKTEAPKTEAPKIEKPAAVSPAKTEAPKIEKTATVNPAKTEAPKVEKPTPVSPAEMQTTVDVAPAGLSGAQQSRIPKALAGLSGQSVGAVYQALIDTLLPGGERARYVGNDGAFNRAGGLKESLQNLLLTFDKADILYVQGRGTAKKNNQFMNNGSTDVRLRRGYSMVSIDPATKAELRGTPGLLPADRHITQKTVAEAQQRMIYFRTAQAVFDQMAYSRATTEWINRGRKGDSDQGAVLAEIYDQLGKRGGLTPTDVAALRRSAYDLYYDKAIEYGLIHDNYRTITTTTTDLVGDRLAELRSRVALASAREKATRLKTEISGEQFTELVNAERAALDEMGSIRELAEKLYEKNYLSGEDVSDIISAEAQQKSYVIAGATETEGVYHYEEQASTSDRHDDATQLEKLVDPLAGAAPAATIFDRAAEDKMMQGFRRWAEYQMMRDIFAYSRLMKALGKKTADTYKGTDFDLVASAVLPGLNATLSPEMIYSKRSASDVMKKNTTVQRIQSEITGTTREWYANNLWTSEPHFGRDGKRLDLVEKYIEELFDGAEGYAEAAATTKDELTAAQDEARRLARVLRDYNRAGDLGMDPTIGAAEAVIEAESEIKEATAEKISRLKQGRGAPEDEANIVDQVEEGADRGVYESGRDEDGSDTEYEGLRGTPLPTIDAELSESNAEQTEGSYTMDDGPSLPQASYQFDPVYKAIAEEALRNRGITSTEGADPRLVSEALWEADRRYERRIGSADPDAYLADPRFAETLQTLLRQREIPPEPKSGTAAQVKWEDKYGRKYKKAFREAVTRYRDEMRGEGQRKMYGEPIRQRLEDINIRIKELRKTVANRERAAKFYSKDAGNFKTVPAGASLYLLQNLTERVGLGVMTPEQAMNATRAACLLWARDNTITADQLLGVPAWMFSADPARRVDELLKAARRVDLNEIGDKLYRDAVDRAVANDKKGSKATVAKEDVEVLHDLVADSDIVAEESETTSTDRRAEVVKALDEANKIEANDANNIRAEVVRDLRADGATELTAPVGYTETTEVYKVNPDVLAREAESGNTGKPIRVPVRDSSSVAKPYGLGDLNVGDPYSRKGRKKTGERKSMKEILHTIDRLGFNDCEAVSRAGMKQTRMDNLNNHITLVRGASATAGAILTDALVDPNGNVIGCSFAEAFLCYDKKHRKQIDRAAQNTLEKYFLLNMTIDRMSAEVRADRAVADYEALYPELRSLTTEQVLDNRKTNPIIEKYAQLLMWQRGAKNKPVLAVNDTFDDGSPIPLSAEDASRMLNQLQSENPWLRAKADAFYDWWDLFMRTYVVGGAVSEQDYDNIRNAAPHYVPTHREGNAGAIAKEYTEMLSSFAKTMNVGATLKPAKGSTKRVEPIADQMASLISTYVKSYRSRMLVNNFFDELLVDDAGNFSEFGRIVWSKTDPIFQQANGADSDDAGAAVGKVEAKNGEGGGYYLATWRDGKKIVAHITEGMYHSMNNLIGKGYQKVQKAMKIGDALTIPMKAAITGFNPHFAFRNVQADIPNALVNTENHTVMYAKSWVDACAHIAQNSDLWRVYCALGGEHAHLKYAEIGFVNTVDDPHIIQKIGRGTVNTLGAIGETTESVTRFAEFLATIKTMGDTPTTRMIALHRAAEVTVDFSRAGYVSRIVNSWQPYFNPSVQGIAKAFRSVFESKTPGKVIGFSAKTLTRGLLWSILPEIFFGLWRKVKGKEKEFNELSDYVKDNYYMIPIADHKWARLRKTREWAAVFGNAVMRLMEGETGYENPFETYWEISIAGNLLPDLPLGPFLPILQLAWNKNYAGSAIVPTSFDEFKKTHPMEVYDEETSALAYLAATLTSKLSAALNPMAVDYLLNYYFGDFYSQLWRSITWANVKHVTDGEYTILDLVEDSVTMLVSEGTRSYITDDRYSNSTVTRYYDMYSQLRGDVASAKYRNGGATGSLDEAVLTALSNQRYGYSALIQKLSKEARQMPNGEEKAQIKGQIVALAALAQDFYERCMSGEITDPERYIKYSALGGTVCDELIWLGEPADGYNPENIDFDPTFSCPAYLRDPSNAGKQFKLTGDDDMRGAFISLYEKNFSEAATRMIRSSAYQSLSKSAKAAAMQQQESYALAQTKSEFAEFLRSTGAKSTGRTLASVEIAKTEASYVLRGINNPKLAIDDDVIGELVALDSYASKYSFVLSTSVPATFRSQTDSDYVYKLNARQQSYYETTRASLYNDAMTSVIMSERYGEAKPQERAAMLEVACGYVEKELKAKMQKLLDSENAKPTRRVSTAEELIDEEAKYSVARILSSDDAYDEEVTDELLRLYGLSDEYSFQPPTNKPKSYVDPKNRSKEYVLTEEQQEKYVEISHATYNDAVLTIITDPSYALLTDAQKAERLNAMRSRLSEVVKNEFLLWLSQNTTSTDREADKVSKETKRYVKALLGW